MLIRSSGHKLSDSLIQGSAKNLGIYLHGITNKEFLSSRRVCWRVQQFLLYKCVSYVLQKLANGRYGCRSQGQERRALKYIGKCSVYYVGELRCTNLSYEIKTTKSRFLKYKTRSFNQPLLVHFSP